MKKIILKILYIFIFIFLCEILTRSFFPDFINREIISNNDHHIIQGKNNYYKNIVQGEKITKIRDSKIDKLTDYKNLIYILGDSVTAGFGLSYQNTFYSITENLLNSASIPVKILPLAKNGSNLFSEKKSFKEFYKNNNSKEKKIVIYQFAYNDLSPSYLYNRNLEYDNFGPNQTSNLYKKIAINTAKLRYQYLNKSAFLSLAQFYIGKIRYKSWSSSCSTRGNFALGEWTFAYRGKGFEKDSDKIWKMFEEDLLDLKNFSQLNNLDFYVLISPLSVQVPNHEQMNIYNYDLKCATQDPRKFLISLLKKNFIDYIDPTGKMIAYSNNFLLEGNKEQFFFDLDYAHPNELGSRIIAESLFEFLLTKIK